MPRAELTPDGRRVIVRVEAGVAHPVDGLSACCFKPSLLEVPILSLTAHGVPTIGAALVCRDCRHRATRAT